MRGTFANTRIKNQMVPGIEGGVTAYLPGGEVMPIYDAAMKYQAAGVPLIVIAGKEYGSGSSRDWAAKGTMLLGVKAVIAESYERIHRSNLVNMGVLPLQFKAGETCRDVVPDRPRSVRVDRRRRGAASRGPRSRCTRARRTAAPPRSPRSPASIRPRSWSPSRTAASCRTCFVSW